MTSKDYMKSLSMLNLALIMGLVIFSMIVSFLILTKSVPMNDVYLYNVLKYLVPILSFGGLLAGNAVFKSRLNAISENSALIQKLNEYRAALIIRYALLEGPAIFSVISAFITTNINFLLFTGMLAAMMFYFRPRIQSIVNDLDLNEQERILLEDSTSVLD